MQHISISDTVLAYDPDTGEVGEYEVTNTISHTDEDIIHLYLDGELIETTAEHPFYTNDGTWITAADLSLGEQILSLDGDYGTVQLVILVEDVYQPMYNLTIADVHTFAVGEGQWVVHNQKIPVDVRSIVQKLQSPLYGIRSRNIPIDINAIPENGLVLPRGLKPQEMANLAHNDIIGYYRERHKFEGQPIYNEYGLVLEYDRRTDEFGNFRLIKGSLQQDGIPGVDMRYGDGELDFIDVYHTHSHLYPEPSDGDKAALINKSFLQKSGAIVMMDEGGKVANVHFHDCPIKIV